MNPSSNQPARAVSVSPVVAQLDNLEKRIDECMEIFSHLSTKLEPVLRPVVPTPVDVGAKNAAPEEPLCPIATRLRSLSKKVYMLTATTGYIEERVEV